jgi:hypothetical protein
MTLKTKLLSIIAVLPLFFSWLFVLTFSKDEQVKKHCLYSMAGTVVFFAFLFLCTFLYFLVPFIGGFLASILHFLSVGIYFSFSIFLVYSIVFSKNIELSFLNRLMDKLSFLFDKSTRSSAG